MEQAVQHKQVHSHAGNLSNNLLADILIVQKAHLLMRYEDIEQMLVLCGFSPVDIALYSPATEYDAMAAWRIKLALLKMSSALAKINYNEPASDILMELQQSIDEMMQFLAHDFRQLNLEFLNHLGDSSKHQDLYHHLLHHCDLLEKFEDYLIAIHNKLHSSV